MLSNNTPLLRQLRVEYRRLRDDERKRDALRGAIVGAPADPEAFG